MSTEYFTFQLVHRKGAKYCNADGLSRRLDATTEAPVAAREVNTVSVRGSDSLESDYANALQANDVDEEVPCSAVTSRHGRLDTG